MKHTIWDNNFDTIEETAQDIRLNHDQYDLDKDDDDAIYRLACNWIDSDLDIARDELDIDVGYPIIVFGSLGLWNGRRSAYRELNSQNIKDCLKVCCGDYIEWYVDDSGDLVVRDTHHDGTNYYTFRALRGGMSWTQIDNFWNKMDDGITEKSVKYYTRRLGDYVAKVYGWKLKGGVHA